MNTTFSEYFQPFSREEASLLKPHDYLYYDENSEDQMNFEKLYYVVSITPDMIMLRGVVTGKENDLALAKIDEKWMFRRLHPQERRALQLEDC